MRKIFIFGANGMLGSYLTNYFSNANIIPITRKDIDITKVSQRSILSFLYNRDMKSDDIIINAAGIIKQRKSTSEEMFLVNTIFPKYLADISAKYNCTNIHISTDCVFDGYRGLYTETDFVSPIDYYGYTKYAGEYPHAMVIRTSIIGEDSHGLSLLGWARQQAGKQINGFTNHLWNGLTCLELCKYIDALLLKNRVFKGVQHVATSQPINKYDLLCMYNDEFDLDMNIKPVQDKYMCDRTLISYKDESYDNIIYNKNDYWQQIKELKNAKNIYSDFGYRSS
jgi:dTDP-4-dehydrorhamnose reductase